LHGLNVLKQGLQHFQSSGGLVLLDKQDCLQQQPGPFPLENQNKNIILVRKTSPQTGSHFPPNSAVAQIRVIQSAAVSAAVKVAKTTKQ